MSTCRSRATASPSFLPSRFTYRRGKTHLPTFWNCPPVLPSAVEKHTCLRFCPPALPFPRGKTHFLRASCFTNKTSDPLFCLVSDLCWQRPSRHHRMEIKLQRLRPSFSHQVRTVNGFVCFTLCGTSLCYELKSSCRKQISIIIVNWCSA